MAWYHRLMLRLVHRLPCLTVFNASMCLKSSAFGCCSLLILLIFLVLVAVYGSKISDGVFYSVFGIICFAIFSAGLLLVFAMRIPKIPDADDVDTISISKGSSSFPRAPRAPKRGDLFANGSKWFRDHKSRVTLLRGVNLSSSSKLPVIRSRKNNVKNKDSPDWKNDDKKKDSPDWKDVSFVGRPFPLNEADIHLGRLRAWGFTFLRFIVTWEAVEHEGPGIYDEEYLEYLVAVLKLCSDFGISVFIDFHQDAWSRWTGGDGAPAWTLETAGFDVSLIGPSAAAITKGNDYDVPYMAHAVNNVMLGAGTMWTLFFAGNEFAPKTAISGEPIQEYLQRRFCDMISHVAFTLKDLTNVIGFDLINEPNVGYIGIEDINGPLKSPLLLGYRVNTWSAILLGAGFKEKVNYFSSFFKYAGMRTLNRNEVSAWSGGRESCVWRANGVWDLDAKGEKAILKNRFHFSKKRDGSDIDALNDFLIPFWQKAASAIRKHIPDAMIFTQPLFDINNSRRKDCPKLSDDFVGKGGFVWAKHWYDGTTLVSRNFNNFVGISPDTFKILWGLRQREESFGESIHSFYDEASLMGSGGSPVLVGETGIPFNLKKKGLFTTNDFSLQELALNTTMRALENALVSYSLWTYNPDNTNSTGDNWCGEDLSIFSKSQIDKVHRDDLHAGGRGLHAFIRPFPMYTMGTPVSISFDPYDKARTFIYIFTPRLKSETKETVLFVPKYHYPHGVHVELATKFTKPVPPSRLHERFGDYLIDWEEQTLVYYHNNALDQGIIEQVTIKITKKFIQAFDPLTLA